MLDIIDTSTPAWNGAMPKPRGLLPVPPEVEVIVAKEEAKHPAAIFTAEAKARMRQNLALQFYFEGTDIAYLRTPQGVEILAVGLDEIGDLVHSVPPEELTDVIFAQP